jgi:hypothetical protein
MKLFLALILFSLMGCSAIHKSQYNKLSDSNKQIYDCLNNNFSHDEKIQIIKYFNE